MYTEEKHMPARFPMTDKGKLIYSDRWEIFRHDIGMGEFQYGIFHNDEHFADTPSMARAERIIWSMQQSRGTP
jgi:hypothetical protein